MRIDSDRASDPTGDDKLGKQDIRTKLPGGLLDAGLASLATFLTGVVAVNVLGEVDRGVYAVFFVAFVTGQIIAHRLVYVPLEIEAVKRPVGERLGMLTDSLRVGLGPSIAGALVVLVAIPATSGTTTTEAVAAFAVTSSLTTLVWPIQDHVRRMLHIAGRSWHAAAVSASHLTVTASSLVLLTAANLPPQWIPFGALAIANTISALVGLGLGGIRPGTQVAAKVRFRDLARAGRWLLLAAAIPAGSAFLVAVIITRLAGAEAMGFAEAARVVAQPVTVLGIGLGAVLGPRVMEAAGARDRSGARHARITFMSLTILLSLGYLAVVGVPWWGNPMRVLVPAAYEVEWLALASVGVGTLGAALAILTSELSAAREEVKVAAISAIAAPITVAVATTAGTTGAFARPLTGGVQSAVGTVGSAWVITQIYRDAEQDL